MAGLLVGCSNQEDDGVSFVATVLENNQSSLLVEPAEGSVELSSADRIVAHVSDAIIIDPEGIEVDITAVKVGDKVMIFYDGSIAESYPAQIWSFRVQLMGEPDSGTMNEVVAEDSEVAIIEAEIETKDQVIVDVNILRLRGGPGTDYEILDRLDNGTMLTVIAEDNEWLQVITLDGREGWVHSDYVKISGGKTQITGETAEEMEEETCKTLRYLGMSKEEIVELYGEPHLILDVPGPGGDHYVYNDLPVSFVFAGQTDVVNNLELRKGAGIRGIEIGMTLKEIEEVWGNAESKGYDEGFIDFGRHPWYAQYMGVYIFFKESDGPSVAATVLWESSGR